MSKKDRIVVILVVILVLVVVSWWLFFTRHDIASLAIVIAVVFGAIVEWGMYKRRVYLREQQDLEHARFAREYEERGRYLEQRKRALELRKLGQPAADEVVKLLIDISFKVYLDEHEGVDQDWSSEKRQLLELGQSLYAQGGLPLLQSAYQDVCSRKEVQDRSGSADRLKGYWSTIDPAVEKWD